MITKVGLEIQEIHVLKSCSQTVGKNHVLKSCHRGTETGVSNIFPNSQKSLYRNCKTYDEEMERRPTTIKKRLNDNSGQS